MKNAVILILFSQSQLWAQDSTGRSGFSWGLFLDTYYSYDFNRPQNHRKPVFLYNHNRHNEVNINLALAKLIYCSPRTRMNFGLMAGTYPQYNLAAEPVLLRHIYEGNTGIKVSGKHNLWVDAGIFPSHIGFETAVSKDNWTLTRSIAAENTPYYESGVKLGFTSNDGKLFISGLVLNGWQRIERPQGNNTVAIGSQLTITPNDNCLFNWSSFVGNDKPDNAIQMRYFNNFYAIIKRNNFGITAGIDIGIEEDSTRQKLLQWISPVVILRYLPSKTWALAVRGEYYSDPKGIIIPTASANGFRCFGFSINMDKKIDDKFLWRTEGKLFKSPDAIFQKNGTWTKSNFSISCSIAVSLP